MKRMPAPEYLPRKKISRRAALGVPILAFAAAGTGVSWGMSRALPAVQEVIDCPARDAAEVIPESGALFGVNLDWHAQTLSAYAAGLGHRPAITVQFSDFPYDRATWKHSTDAAEQIRANGGAMLLTLEPHGGLVTCSDTEIATLVRDVRALNESGVPVIIRFAHEMNGSWYAWSQDPTEYRATFRRVAAAVHAGAPGSAMMWAPNYGGGYPFTGGRFQAEPGSAAYELLDTNGDGVVDDTDDPYRPYFPGSDAVDWVGISLYHWGNYYPWGNNEIPEDGKFTRMLTGNYNGTAGNDSARPDFYHDYGVKEGKPIAIPETSAIYTPSRTEPPRWTSSGPGGASS